MQLPFVFWIMQYPKLAELDCVLCEKFQVCMHRMHSSVGYQKLMLTWTVTMEQNYPEAAQWIKATTCHATICQRSQVMSYLWTEQVSFWSVTFAPFVAVHSCTPFSAWLFVCVSVCKDAILYLCACIKRNEQDASMCRVWLQDMCK